MREQTKRAEPIALPLDWEVWALSSHIADEDRRRMLIAALLACLFNLLFFLLLPVLGNAALTLEDIDQSRKEYQVELLDPAPRYVEANPEVPVVHPPETNQEAAQDQRAAQPEPSTQEDSERPTVDGEVDSQKIIDGEQESLPQPPDLGAPLQRPQPDQQQDVQVAENGMDLPVTDHGARIKQDGNQWKEPTTSQQGTVEVVLEEVSVPNHPAGQPQPQPRPRLTPKVPLGPIMRSPTASSRLGALAIDAKFSEFGAYQQRMIEAISYQWNLLGNHFAYVAADIGSEVVVRFRLHSDGNISEFTVLSTTASRAATLLVQDAVMSPAPFGDWTDNMLHTLGDSQEIKITFYYR